MFVSGIFWLNFSIILVKKNRLTEPKTKPILKSLRIESTIEPSLNQKPKKWFGILGSIKSPSPTNA